MKTEEIVALNKRFNNLRPEEVLIFFMNKYRGRIALASNFGAEDQVLTDMMMKLDQTAKIFTLDTEKLFKETHNLIEKTNYKYHLYIETYHPDDQDLIDAFEGRSFHSIYDSIENRKKCCHARKVIPLNKALSNLDAWITGIRIEQSVTRQDMQMIEWDEDHQMLKISPLFYWSEEQVWDYINSESVPYNALHDNGYPSIGCEPCTRQIEKGEDIRSGRWWWENPMFRECGLHKKVDPANV